MMGHQMLENESENLEFKNYKMSFMMSHTGNKAFIYIDALMKHICSFLN